MEFLFFHVETMYAQNLFNRYQSRFYEAFKVYPLIDAHINTVWLHEDWVTMAHIVFSSLLVKVQR